MPPVISTPIEYERVFVPDFDGYGFRGSEVAPVLGSLSVYVSPDYSTNGAAPAACPGSSMPARGSEGGISHHWRDTACGVANSEIFLMCFLFKQRRHPEKNASVSG